jgi:hypothetical protein
VPLLDRLEEGCDGGSGRYGLIWSVFVSLRTNALLAYQDELLPFRGSQRNLCFRVAVRIKLPPVKHDFDAPKRTSRKRDCGDVDVIQTKKHGRLTE